MNGAGRELVAVGGVLWVKDGHCLGVGHTLGYAWHIPACYQLLLLGGTTQSTGCHPSFCFRYVLTLRVNIACQHVSKGLDLF